MALLIVAIEFVYDVNPLVGLSDAYLSICAVCLFTCLRNFLTCLSLYIYSSVLCVFLLFNILLPILMVKKTCVTSLTCYDCTSGK